MVLGVRGSPNDDHNFETRNLIETLCHIEVVHVGWAHNTHMVGVPSSCS